MKQKIWIYISVLAVVLAFGVFSFYFLPGILEGIQNRPQAAVSMGYSSNAVRAIILRIEEEGMIQLGEVEQIYQILRVRIEEGEYQGVEFSVDYGKRQLRPEGLNLNPGDRIIVSVDKDPNNHLLVQFQDFVRLGPLLILFFTFVLFSILISGWKGVRGLLGMGISIGVILFYIIPQILAGKDPVLISVTGAFFLLAVTLYLVYGWNLKTHSAVVGTLVALILTAFLASIFVDLTRLTGFGSEEALFLSQQTSGIINLRGLILGGMLIGALGVLDDLVITQASVVFELYSLSPGLTFKGLVQRAMRVGQDHVAATVNTLVLAYVGAALPLFLMFTLSETRLSYLLNLEYLAEEIVRTLVGSLGLVAAVPLTTLLAALLVKNHDSFSRFQRILGPLNSGNDHHHG